MQIESPNVEDDKYGNDGKDQPEIQRLLFNRILHKGI
jgi:hypothetical protein